MVGVNGKVSSDPDIQSSLSVSNTIRIKPRTGENTVTIYAFDEGGLRSREIWRRFEFP